MTTAASSAASISLAGSLAKAKYSERRRSLNGPAELTRGEHSYPCSYVITTKDVDQGPQYSIQIRDWNTGGDVAADDFGFKNAANAQRIDQKELTGIDELPSHSAIGGAQ